jgi:hypothetical protein
MEAIWRQKSRHNWCKLGDKKKNTRVVVVSLFSKLFTGAPVERAIIGAKGYNW